MTCLKLCSVYPSLTKENADRNSQLFRIPSTVAVCNFQQRNIAQQVQMQLVAGFICLKRMPTTRTDKPTSIHPYVHPYVCTYSDQDDLAIPILAFLFLELVAFGSKAATATSLRHWTNI